MLQLTNIEEIRMELRQTTLPKTWFTINQTAEYLQCSCRTIWRLLEKGQLKYHRFGTGAVRQMKIIHIDSINRMLGSNTPVSLQRRDFENLKMAG